MSYWVYLQKDGTNVEIEKHEEGGTFELGGTTEAVLNVTWNYAEFYCQELDEDQGLRWLNGKTAAETMDRLAHATAELGDCRDPDYWAATPGNAGHALAILWSWARQHPGAVWVVS